MSGSAAEREIRDYSVRRLREMLPDARIVHELVVGGCRADLAAIQPERITLVEIKSERDTLGRLKVQVKHFSRASHEVVVIAHERWFDRSPYNDGRPRFVPSKALSDPCGVASIWAYPEVVSRRNYGPWALPRHWSSQPEPRASDLLHLCWKQELLEEARAHRLVVGARDNMARIVREMSWMMTGREIAQAVCRQLRKRHFPEADAPVIDRQAA